MKLRNKLLIGMSIAWAVFLVSAFVGSRYILIQSFLRLEHQQATQDLQRVNQAINQIDYSLYTFTSDWSHWNDLYAFMQGKNPGFISNNVTLSAFVNSNINLLTYWNTSGNLAVAVSVDTLNQKFNQFPVEFTKYLNPANLIHDVNKINHDVRGLILLPNQIMMLATSSITNGNKTLPALGTTISGRILSPQIIQQLSVTTGLSVQLLLPNEISADNNTQTIYRTIINNKSDMISVPMNDDTLQAFNILWDIDHKPIGMLRITIPRSIYISGLHAINYFLIIFGFLAVLFSTLMILLIRSLIIDRLEELENKVKDIRNNAILSQRVNITGNDELSSVATGINSLMDIIQSSHENLESRVEERTLQLQESNNQLKQEILVRQSIENELLDHKEHLIKLAHYDNLTGLPNRIFFNEMLNKSISHANRKNKLIAVLFLDLDRFKSINDAFGHSIGDLVLKEVTSRFSSVIRSEDMLARLGGDEFIVMLNDIDDPKYSSSVAEKLLHTCESPIKIHEHEFHISASIGISIFPTDGRFLEDLQKNSDIAMYKSKKMGGNAYQYFKQDMNLKAHEHIKLEAALRNAFKNDEFLLYFQPKYRLSDGLIVGVEALIRWESPEYGLISPDKFIPLAEETGLIMALGEWVLREACIANKKWQADGYQFCTVSVNISPKQFSQHNIAEKILSILTETKLDPQYLELEITETAVMEDIPLAINRMLEITKMGVQLSIDDFGTGYTSISNLKNFPVSILKIDRNFIRGIPKDKNDTSITTAIISLGHNLNMKVVAEGVETAEQLQFLADHDCDIVQGYYLSRPLPEQKLVLLLSKIKEHEPA